MPGSARERTLYTFGPLERRGVFGALRASQAAVLGVGLLAGVAVVQTGSSGLHLLGALGLSGAAAWVAFHRVHGRTLEEWAPVLSRYGLRRARGGTRYRSGAAAAGLQADGDDFKHPVSLPEELRGLELLGAPLDRGGGVEIGVAADRPAQTFTAALSVRVRSFGLLSDGEQERRLALWGSVLAALAREGSPIRRVGWVERTVAGDGDELGRYLQEGRDRSLPLASSTVASYIELVESAADVTQDHELLVSLQLDGRRAWRQAKQLGRGDEGVARLLVRELDLFARRLDGAGIVVHGALTPRLYAKAIRDGFDPFGRLSRTRAAALDSERAGSAVERPGPIAAEASWDRYRADSADHVTYWMAEWPRLDVGATFLQPLLVQTNIARSVAVVMEALPPSRAIAEVERARTDDIADQATRDRFGQVTTARQRQKSAAAARREEEITRGHAELRYAGFVTVSAPAGNGPALEAACAEVEHAAQQSLIGLERLYGAQDSAFTFTLPLCRGLA